jgi:undecaprenyl-diphosphatase
MTWFQVLFLSVLQGASELFPVSSLGHAVVVPALLGWTNLSDVFDPAGPFLPFLVMLHLGTATALLIFYWKDWQGIISAFFGQFGTKAKSVNATIANLLLAGTIPTAILGFVFEKKLRNLFASPKYVAILLIVNGVMMIVGEMLRQSSVKKDADAKSSESKTIDQLSTGQAIGIGIAQSFALLPGISRSGATITGGLLAKLGHESAARFSFLLATPIILAAGILEAPKLRHNQAGHIPHIMEYSAVGFVVAGITAYLSVKFLTKYFETNRLDPFGYYCIILGAVTLLKVMNVF